jgi:hypothetical protein
MGDSYEHSTDGRDVGGHGTSRQEAPGVTRQPDNSEHRMATYREKEVPNVSSGPNVHRFSGLFLFEIGFWYLSSPFSYLADCCCLRSMSSLTNVLDTLPAV